MEESQISDFLSHPMATVQVAVQLSPETLLQAVSQLSNAELKAFVAEVLSIADQRQRLQSPNLEAVLLEQATQRIPPELDQKLSVLIPKRQSETLSEPEHQELIELTHEVESLNALRMAALAELATIRSVSLTELMSSLSIQPVEYV